MEGYRAAAGSRRTRRHVSVGVLLAHALPALTACTGAAEPAAIPDTLPGVSTTAAAGVATGRTAGRDLGDCIAREYLSMAPR